MSNFSALIAKSPQFRMEIQGHTGFEGAMPPADALDREAELKITGGYDVGPENLCAECWQYRAACGQCGCL